MKKYIDENVFVTTETFRKILLKMKFTILLIFIAVIQVSASVYSQETYLNLSVKDKSLRDVFKLIEKESNFRFFYNDEFTELDRNINIDIKDKKIDDILAMIFTGSEVTYRILENNIIVITPFSKTLPQQLVIQGKVTDATSGEPLPGVNIVVEGTSIGTISGENGEYSIEVPDSRSVLVFSFVGMISQKIVVGNQQIINVSLQPDLAQLEEVVVVGYGAQKKKDVTGAVAVISSKDMEARANTQFGNSIEGKAAGVQVIRPSGQPQAGFSIRIRGTSSITSASDPLYIVDGVQTYSINEINPADIESISVLKDASSAAIYGSSGANGVVLITTKHGSYNQKTRVTFNSSMMTSQAWKKLSVLNSEQFKDLAIELGLPSIDWSRYSENTNWQDLVFRNAFTQNYQLAVTGGDNKTSYYVSGSAINQEGIVLNNSVKRATFKINFDHKVSSFFKVGTNLSYDKWTDIPVPENDRNGVITRLLTTVPIIGVWDKDNPAHYALNPFIPDLENPVSTVYQPEQNYKNNRFHGNAFAELSPLKDLKFKSLLGFEHSNGIFSSFLNPIQTRYGRTMDGIANEGDYEYTYWVTENTLDFTKQINEHNISVLAGFIASRENSHSVWLGSHGFGGSSAIKTVTPGTVQSVPQVSIYEKSHAAFIARLNYSFKDKYLITSNFRADGSGQFSPENRWGYFPSFSAGWRISKEEFFQNITAINDLKLRIGWGLVGNDRANPYAWYGLVSPAFYVIGGNLVNASYPSTLENSALRWEKTGQLNIGIDAAILNSRISFSADYYNKKTTDLLLYVPIPASVGIPDNTALQNAGSLQNKGFELQFSSKNILKEHFTWNTDFNINFNRSKVLDVVGTVMHTGPINPAGTTYNLSIVKAGEPLGIFYGYISDGVDPETGMIMYRDLNSDGSIDDNDKTIIGNANPKFTYGLTNSFSFKNFTLDIFLQGVQGNDIFNATRILTESMRLGMNQSATVINRWRKPGDKTSIPKAIKDDVTNSNISTRYIEDGSYLRVKSVTLGYKLPEVFVTKFKITQFMVFVTAENLLTFTKYSGFDPEVSAFNSSNMDNTNKNTAPGVDYGTYPQSRDFIFGINVTF